MSQLKKAVIFADSEAALAELYGGASTLAESVAAFYIGAKADVKGAETIYYLGERQEGALPEQYTPSMIALVQGEQPELVLFSSSRRCRLMAGMLAGALHTSVQTDASEVSLEDGVVSSRMVYGGAAYRRERAAGTAVLCVSAGTFASKELPQVQNIVEVPYVAPNSTVRLLSTEKKEGENVNLEAAKIVVCVGRGFQNAEELSLAEEFASVVGGVVGCTRPIAEDGLMGKNRYVGVSGVMLKPDVYFGFGLSGQIQHTVGVNSARVMIAINKDKQAPIFQQSDCGLVGNVAEVLPVLIQKLKEA